MLVLDRGPGPGMGSTSSSSAVIRFNYSTRDGVVLAWEALQYWLDWPAHIGVDDEAGLARFHRVGLLAFDPPGREEARGRMLGHFDAVGVANEVIRPAEGGDDLPVAVPIAVAVAEEGDNWAVFARTLDDRVVELAVDGGVLTEVGGDGRWDPVTGLGLDDTDQNLSLLPGFTSFPRDYTTFFPDGAVWQPSGTVTVEELLDS